MRGFLRFIGIVELIGYFTGIIIWLIKVPFSGWSILYFFVYLIFAPAFACLCFAVANLIDKTENLENRIRNLEKKNGVVINENVKIIDDEGYLILENATHGTGYSVVELLTEAQDKEGRKIRKGSTGLLVQSNLNEGEIEFQIVNSKNIVIKLDKSKFVKK